MNSTIKNLYSVVLILLISCGSGNENKNLETEPIAANASVSLNGKEKADGVVGEWEQQYTCFDKNGNYKLEPEENKPSNTRVGFDWFKFNADRSCLRDKEVKFKSTYEIQNKGNTKELIIHNVHDFTIIELTDEELILGGDGAFIVYKKIK